MRPSAVAQPTRFLRLSSHLRRNGASPFARLAAECSLQLSVAEAFGILVEFCAATLRTSDGGVRDIIGATGKGDRRVRTPARRERTAMQAVCPTNPPSDGAQIEPLAPPITFSVNAPVRTSEPPARGDLSVPEKIALFRSLFRGREDVYALRWEKADGKSGYSPASIRDWKAVMSVPPAERKKLDQATRQLLPLTDDAVHQHLSGKNTIGVYPLLPDETCWFLAVDFDQESWKLDAVSFVESCRETECSSRAGALPFRGGRRTSGYSSALRFRPRWHASWGRDFLTRTMQRRHQISLKSYDRLFPNQDTMPTGGFGNLIALPLQKIPRRADNSVFVDDHLGTVSRSVALSGRHPQNGTLRRRASGPQSGAERKCRRRPHESCRQ